MTPSQTATPLTAADFVLISAVNNDMILDACLRRSPDVADGRLPLVVVRGARSMAEAYNRGLAETDATICLLAHQDVYLPAGWLDRAIERLNALTRDHPGWRAAGPYGVRADGRHVGRVWDATMARELGQAGFAPTPIVSLDELLLVLRRDTPFRFDPDLPDWHLYGTDLVQDALAAGRSAWAVELPLVHNNRPIVSLRGGYETAYKFARRKWRARLPIATSICYLSRNPLHLWRVQWRRRHVKARPDDLLADAVQLARAAGYE